MTAPGAPVEIVPYDPAWPAKFDAEAATLRKALAPWLAGPIEHIGSTAVPGLAAKPVIDIMAGVHSLDASRPAIAAAGALGYCYFPYQADREHWFCKPSPAHRTHHLHLVPTASPQWARAIAFRDYLRRHPETARDYETLKRQLAVSHHRDREAYTDAKRPFIDRISDLALQATSPISKPVLRHRLARREDADTLRALIDAAIGELQQPFLDASQIASSRAIMGLDMQLIDDGSYFIVEADGEMAGCGGWSRRATLYGGDQTPGRSAALLNPSTEPARIRAMYTHPRHVRKGVGRLILRLCEEAASAEGFRRVELMSTLAGEPLYLGCGYLPVERLTDSRGGAPVPLVRMRKSLDG